MPNKYLKYLLWIVLLSRSVSPLNAQDSTLTIEQCYELARKNYPLVKQLELIEQTKNYNLDNLSKGYYPQVNVVGQATYQSVVTSLPIRLPGVTVPELSKDQYKIYADISQTIYDGGMMKSQKQIQEANAEAEVSKTEVELYKLRERINSLYFGILLMDEQLKLTELMKNDIRNGMTKMEALIKNGTAFRSSLDMLKAELLKADQKTIELIASREAYIQMLSVFTGKQIASDAVLTVPTTPAVSSDVEIKRPEIGLFDAQSRMLASREALIGARNTPRFSAFVQAGFGRPALNMLSNEFEPYYIGGVRLTWNLSGFYTSSKERKLIQTDIKTISIQKDNFLLNTAVVVKQQNGEINKLEKLLQTDSEIIELRASVKNTSSVQLGNGVISGNDYVREVNAEDNAKQTKALHELQLLMAKYNLQFTTN